MNATDGEPATFPGYPSPMPPALALLAAAWSSDDVSPLLILADLLEERGGSGPAELIRLVHADARTCRHSPERTARLRQLRHDAWNWARKSEWPYLALQGNTATSFARDLFEGRPKREFILLRPPIKAIYRLTLARGRRHEIVPAPSGQELLSRPLGERELNAGRQNAFGRGVFSLAQDFVPLPADWQLDREGAEADRRERFEAALAPANIEVCDMPEVLAPFAAWAMMESLSDRERRFRAGELVPGSHLFLYRPDTLAWEYATSLENYEAGRGNAILRQRLQSEQASLRGAVAGLLARVSDAGRVAARKLVWLGWDREFEESPALAGAGDSVQVELFSAVADDLGLPESFVLNLEGIRGLFGIRAEG